MAFNILIAENVQIPVVMQPVSDLVCFDDVDLFARETTDLVQILIQDVYHWLIEDLGTNLDVPDRGIGIYGLLSGTVKDLKAIANKIDQQFGNLDARIDASQTTITQDSQGVYQIGIALQVDGQKLGLSFVYAPGRRLSLASWGFIKPGALL